MITTYGAEPGHKTNHRGEDAPATDSDGGDGWWCGAQSGVRILPLFEWNIWVNEVVRCHCRQKWRVGNTCSVDQPRPISTSILSISDLLFVSPFHLFCYFVVALQFFFCCCCCCAFFFIIFDWFCFVYCSGFYWLYQVAVFESSWGLGADFCLISFYLFCFVFSFLFCVCRYFLFLFISNGAIMARSGALFSLNGS